MFKVTGALIVIVGMSVGVGSALYAQSNDANSQSKASPPKNILRPVFVSRQKVCRYHCPPGLNVCPTGDYDSHGCELYYCFKGTIGNGACN
jgi:hypothetical protein